MANLNQSLKEAVCIDEEVFFGPITDKERKVRQQFEILHGNERKVVESCKIVEDDESQNHSMYKSFSVDESKYDSFDDSLNEEVDKMPQETKVITMRKSYDKIKSKRSGFYDSLEDVCSLVSNFDKCSVSCEVENESNLNSKHFVEDSLKIPPVAIANKNYLKNDQIHFDDDSLAIIECETTFSDSLEEVNVLESIEIEEINDIENITVENQNIVVTVDQHSTCPPKNLFETSVEIICEKMKDSDTADQEESFDDKNLLYDSLSNSDFKEILTDSLEESEQLKKMLSKHLTTNATYEKENAMDSQNILICLEQNSVYPPSNLFDTSVQIVSEKRKDSSIASSKESFKDCNICDSFSNSEIKDVSKDSLEESDKRNEILNVFQQDINVSKSEHFYPNQNALETSVQVVYDNSSDGFEKRSVDNKTYNSEENLGNYNCFQEACAEQRKNETGSNHNPSENLKKIDADKNTLFSDSHVNEDTTQKISVVTDPAITTSANDVLSIQKETFSEECSKQIKIETGQQSSTSKSTCSFQNPVENFKNIDADENVLLSDLHVNKDNKRIPNVSTVTDPTITISANDLLNSKNEAFSVESCHVKILNDDINTDKDLKLQLHIEVTVGDKKCQISSQDIKIVPVISQSSKSEIDSISTASVAKPASSSISSTTSCITFEKNKHAMDLNNPDLNLKMKDSQAIRADPPSEIKSVSPEKSETGLTRNITQRAKSSASQISCSKFSYMDSFNDVSLLQALDLPDLSGSFLNESVIQSKDSLMPLNLYSPDEYIQNFHIPQFQNKENIPEHMHVFEDGNFHSNRKSVSPNKMHNSKTPQSLHKCSSFKETSKKTPGTKIPVRKVDNFAVPAPTPSKLIKPIPTALSAEKVKKCQHSPHSADSGKKAGKTPNKIPHICKVRNTIFSKVPQIIPSKKYMNVQSPVAQYIKNNNGAVKTPGIDPVLRDCMNQLGESPHHLLHAPTSGLKSSKK